MNKKKDFEKIARLLSFRKEIKKQAEIFDKIDLHDIDNDVNGHQFATNTQENNIPTDEKGFIDFEKISRNE